MLFFSEKQRESFWQKPSENYKEIYIVFFKNPHETASSCQGSSQVKLQSLEDFIWKTPKKTHQKRKVYYSLSLWGLAQQYSAVVPSPRSEGGRERGERNRCSVDKINKHSPPRENCEWCSKITLGSKALALPRSAVVMEVILDGTCLQWAIQNWQHFHETIQRIHSGVRFVWFIA